MTIAESERGSSPSAFMRRKVSRHEIPTSTRMRVVDVCTKAQFPRLPLASIVTDTLIRSQDTLETCGCGSNFLVSRDLRVRPSLVAQDVADRLVQERTPVRACDSGQKRQKRFVHLRAIHPLFQD